MATKRARITDLDLVGQIYDAALNPELWPSFLEGFSAKVGAQSGAITYQDFHNKHIQFVKTYERDDTYFRSYDEYYIKINPLLDILSTHKDSAYVTHQLIPQDRLVKSEFYNDWMAPQDTHYHVGNIVFRDDNRIAIACYQRPKRSSYFGKSAIRQIRRFEPHLKRALHMNQKFWMCLAQPAAAAAVLDHLELGVVLIDDREQPIYLNKRAEQLIDAKGGLVVKSDGISARWADDARGLEYLIGEAVSTGKGEGLHPGGLICLGAKHDQPLYLLISPLRNERNDLGFASQQICAAIFVSAPDMNRCVPLEALKILFGLTSAEANLVQELSNGLNLDDVSDKLHISKHTARDHLKAVFTKTKTRRQSELAKLVLASPTSFVGEHLILDTSLAGPMNRRQHRDRREELRAAAENPVN